MSEEDYRLIKDNLNKALDYEKQLNQQIMGRLDAYEQIIRSMLNLLIEKSDGTAVKWNE